MISFRKHKTVDFLGLEHDVAQSALCAAPASTATDSAFQYHHVLSATLDKPAPMKTKLVSERAEASWFNNGIRGARARRRKAERRWRETGLTIHRDIFNTERLRVNTLVQSQKREYSALKIQEHACSQKGIFKVVDSLLQTKGHLSSLPQHSCARDLADNFDNFFTNKISTIYQALSVIPVGSTQPSNDMTDMHTEEMASLAATTEDEVRKIILVGPSKTCSLDPMPTSMVKDCLQELAPVITNIINSSMAEGVVPTTLKHANVVPVLKKPSLDKDLMKNYRPVSNLTYLSKMLEKVVAQRLLDHMAHNNLHETLQSAYKPAHSSETSLLRVQNDFLQAIDKRQCGMLILLDQYVAFDTVDHSVLLQRLSDRLNVKDTALNWFESYLSDRTHSVVVSGESSHPVPLSCGIPQGSILGPALFTVYTMPLGGIIRRYEIYFHLYADDTQLYIFFKPSRSGFITSKSLLHQCVAENRMWMRQNFLKLNSDKTEVIFYWYLAAAC